MLPDLMILQSSGYVNCSFKNPFNFAEDLIRRRLQVCNSSSAVKVVFNDIRLGIKLESRPTPTGIKVYRTITVSETTRSTDEFLHPLGKLQSDTSFVARTWAALTYEWLRTTTTTKLSQKKLIYQLALFSIA